MEYGGLGRGLEGLLFPLKKIKDPCRNVFDPLPEIFHSLFVDELSRTFPEMFMHC